MTGLATIADQSTIDVSPIAWAGLALVIAVTFTILWRAEGNKIDHVLDAPFVWTDPGALCAVRTCDQLWTQSRAGWRTCLYHTQSCIACADDWTHIFMGTPYCDTHIDPHLPHFLIDEADLVAVVDLALWELDVNDDSA